MLKNVLLTVAYVLSIPVFSQLIEDFEDADLSKDPAWWGMTSDFTTINGELRSNYATQNAVFSISAASIRSTYTEWRIDCRLLLNPSSVNYVDIIVMSDSQNLARMRNGYFVRLGGTQDDICLYKVASGTESKIIDGKDGLLNTSKNEHTVILQRWQDSLVLKHRKLASATVISEGWTRDSGIQSSGWLGIRIRQSTASFVNKHFFDNLYAGDILVDTMPPALDSAVALDSNRLMCYFSEAVDTAGLLKDHFKIIPGDIRPSAFVAGPGLQSLRLDFNTGFTTNHELRLEVDSIRDEEGNISPQMSARFVYWKADTPGLFDLLITEIMADPDPSVGLPLQEYAELTNVSGKFLYLGNCRLRDATAYKQLPARVLAPDSMILLNSVPSLNNTGDRVWLEDHQGTLLHSVSYTDAWYRDDVKKQGGYSLEMIDYSQPCLGAENWTGSTAAVGGTPGRVNAAKASLPRDNSPPKIVRYSPATDSTLLVVFDEPVDSLSLLKAKFTVNTYRAVFSLRLLAQDNHEIIWRVGFKPSKDSVYSVLLSGIADCSGNTGQAYNMRVQWPSQSRKEDMVINELLFNPRSGGSDFIEIYNKSGKAFEMSKHFIADLDNGGLVKDIYPICKIPAILQPGQYLLLTEDTANICNEYRCLNPGALVLQIEKLPAMPDDAGSIVLVNLLNEYIDSLRYSEDWHFPLISDKSGVSLERLSYTMPGNSPSNWHSAASAAGFASPGYRNSQYVLPLKPVKYFNVQSKTLSPDQDGFEDLCIISYRLPGPDYLASAFVYDMQGRMLRKLVNNQTLGTGGILTWDGTDEQHERVPTGIYLIFVECIHPDGSRIRQKLSVVVAEMF